MRGQWDSERQILREVQELRAQMERVHREAEEAERNYDLDRAAQLRHGELPDLERRLKEAEDKLATEQGEHRLLREVVTEDEIAGIVSRWTGIPVSRLQEGEREKLLRLDAVLHERVVGQDEAVLLVADAVIRAPPGSRTLADPSAHLFSSAPPGWARPSWPRRWLRLSSIPKRTWSAST